MKPVSAICSILLVAALMTPPLSGPGVLAESSWTSTTREDFNGTGSSFSDCELNGTGEEASVSLVRRGGWVEVPLPLEPPIRKSCTMAAVATDDRAVMFGGADSSNDLNDTWVYDYGDGRWEQVSPPERPPARQLSMLATVFGDDRLVLFGGLRSSSRMMNDTWVYDAGENQWYNRSPADSPSGRFYFGMTSVYNSDEVVLFGGTDDPNFLRVLGDTWVYDVGDNTWSRKSTQNSPPARCWASMGTVWNDDKVVLFGGLGSSSWYNDTWVYDLGDNHWYQKSPPSSPRQSSCNALATVYGDDRVFLYGDTGTQNSWYYDPGADRWTEIKASRNPNVRGGFGLAAIPGTDRTVLFAGQYGNIESALWIFNASAYYQWGVYTSPYHDVGGTADFLSICWSAPTPPGTMLRFQARTADTLYNLQHKNFTGPGGLGYTYYNSASALDGTQPGERWVQYKAYLTTEDLSASPLIASVTIRLNRLPGPPSPLEPENGIWVNSSSPVFRWAFNDTDSSVQAAFEWQLRAEPDPEAFGFSSGEVFSGATSFSFDRPIAEGTWYWRVRSRDEGEWGPFSGFGRMGIDTGAPLPFMPVADPPGWTNGRALVSFSTNDSVSGIESYGVWIDGEFNGTHSSPLEISGLADGRHLVAIRAFDRAGNFAEGNVMVSLDSTPPEPFLPVVDTPSWTSSGPAVSFYTTDLASGVAGYEIKMDNRNFTAATSPFRLPPMEDGAHNLTVRALDRAGNHRDAEITVYTDRNAPANFSAAVSPGGWTNEDPVLTFSASDNYSGIDHFEVAVDGENLGPRASPLTFTDLEDGIHQIAVGAVDRAGNRAEVTVQAMVDRTPPDLPAPVAEPGSWSPTAPRVYFCATDNASGLDRFEIAADDGNYSIASSPSVLAGLPDGRHIVTVRAYDLAGNRRDACVTVFVDRTPPENLSLTIEGGRPSTAGRTVSLEISGADATSGLDRMRFSNDGVNYSPWEPFSPKKSWDLSPGEGPKTVHVLVRDKAGNEAGASSNILVPAPPAPEGWQAPAMLLPMVLIGAALAAGYCAYRLRLGGKRGETSPGPRKRARR